MGIDTGRVLASRYRAEELLGRGGMGEVWRCHDLAEDRPVAVKTVLSLHLAESSEICRRWRSSASIKASPPSPARRTTTTTTHRSEPSRLNFPESRFAPRWPGHLGATCGLVALLRDGFART